MPAIPIVWTGLPIPEIRLTSNSKTESSVVAMAVPSATSTNYEADSTTVIPIEFDFVLTEQQFNQQLAIGLDSAISYLDKRTEEIFGKV